LRVAGKAGTGVAVGVATGVAVGTAVAIAVELLATGEGPALPLQAARTRMSPASAAMSRPGGVAGWAGRDGNTDGTSETGMRSEGSATHATPRFGMAEGGASAGGMHGPAYLSLEGSSMHRAVGDRTLALIGAITVAGLCRDLTGFATTRRDWLSRPLYHPTTELPGPPGQRATSPPISRG
jgi:hypothetical protein